MGKEVPVKVKGLGRCKEALGDKKGDLRRPMGCIAVST